MSKHYSTDNRHKQALKSELIANYTNIIKGQKMKKSHKIGIKSAAMSFAAVALLFTGTAGLVINNSKLTASKALAQAQEHYAESGSKGRFIYQRAVTESRLPESLQSLTEAKGAGDATTERWYDTQTGNEKLVMKDTDGNVMFETLTVDGVSYHKQGASAGVLGSFGIDGDVVEMDLGVLQEDLDETGFPNSYKSIGIDSYEQLEAADLSAREIDEMFAAKGLPEPNAFLKDLPSLGEGIDAYNSKPSELEALFDSSLHNSEAIDIAFDADAEYEQCIAAEHEFGNASKLNIFYEGTSTPAEYSAAFKDLAEDDFFTVEESTWMGQEVYELRHNSELHRGLAGSGSEVMYLNANTYSLVGIEADFGDWGGGFTIKIEEETYSNNSFDISTDGYQAELELSTIIEGIESVDGFNCEIIKDSSGFASVSGMSGPGVSVESFSIDANHEMFEGIDTVGTQTQSFIIDGSGQVQVSDTAAYGESEAISTN